jgi:HK97 family phage major capsid protein/HK97 family phage prohead protease
LLWQHQKDQPIGHVISATVTKAGIKIRAQIAKNVPLPEIERAWTLIKSGLVRGLSIGFKVHEMEPLNPKEPWGGQRFLKWEWLELSAVTIAANAAASIQLIKSLDAPHLAASGQGAGVRSTPGVSGRSQSKSMRSIQQQIDAKLAARKPMAERMKELMDPVLEDDVKLEDAQKTEYDTLAKDVAEIDEQISRFEALERSQMASVTPITAKTIRDGSRQREYGVSMHTKRDLPPGIEYAQAMICKMAAFLALQKGEFKSAIDFAKERYPDNDRLQMFLKAPIAAGNTTDSTWASPLVPDPTNLTGEFLEFLRPLTIVGQFGTNGIPSLNKVPFNVRFGSQTSGGAADWVGEGRAKPLTKFDYDVDILRWAKLATIAIITQELARFSSPNAEERVRNALMGAVVERMDRDFIDPAKALVANVSPASITNGITPLTSSGNDANDIRADVAALLGSFIGANNQPTSAVWIMPNTIALALSLMRNPLGGREFPDITMRGGVFEGIPVIASQYAAIGSPVSNLVILVNANDIFLADDGQVAVDVSTQASVEMDDAPTNSGSPTETTLVSLWQNNLIGLRAERFINWARGRESAVAYMEDVGWTAAGSPA